MVLQRVLGIVTALLAAAGLVAAPVVAGRGGSDPDRSTVPDSPPPPTTLAANQTRVTGFVERATASAIVDTVETPLTVGLAELGRGAVTITGVTVGGEPAEIVWQGGTPFVLEGEGALQPGPVALALHPEGGVVFLDGAPRALAPGHYRTGASVVVGAAGLGTARDGVEFEALPGATVTTRGGAEARFARRPLRARGPGTFELAGALRVTTATGEREATVVRFGPAPFLLTATPVDGGWHVDALVEGVVEG